MNATEGYDRGFRAMTSFLFLLGRLRSKVFFRFWEVECCPHPLDEEGEDD